MYKKKKMTFKEAENISNWHYQTPYDFYNNNGNEETIQEFLEHDYQLVVDDADRIIGFYCTGLSAQVPAGHESHCYPIGFLDIGLGLHPDLTGRGLGSPFMDFILNEVGIQPLRLTVAAFNQRAIRLYKKFGFEEINRFKTSETGFIVMIIKSS